MSQARLHRTLAPLAVLPMLVAVAPAGATPHGDGLVRVSGASPFPSGCADMERGGFGRGFGDAEAEVSVAVDPSDPEHRVVAWMQDLYAGYTAAVSTDGGRTWRGVTVPGTSTCSGGEHELGVDPWVSIGPDGTAYLSGFSLDLPDPAVPVPVRSRLQVSTSPDGGLTWRRPAVVAGGEAVLHDKPAVTADPRRAETAYLTWTQTATAFGPVSSGVYFARTDDAGSSWSAPQPILSPATPASAAHGSELLVLPGGELVVVATMLPSLIGPTGQHLQHTVVVTRSTDGGRTWSAPTTAVSFDTGDESFHSADDPDSGDELQAPSAFVAADAGPDGAVRLVWRHAVTEERSEVRLATSLDQGRTWTAPRTVAAPDAHVFLPQVAVAGDGTIGIAFHDLRNDVRGDGAFTADVWLLRSTDGTRWHETHLAGPLDLRTAPQRDVPAQGRFVGDYHGLAGTQRGFAAALALPAPYAVVGATDVFSVSLPSRRPARPGRQ